MATGDLAVVVHDFGWDYRYLVRLDRYLWGRMFHFDPGVEFDLRPGAMYGWELIER